MGKRMAICESCKNLIEVGDGDFICCECEEPIVVISKFVSTNDYLKCGSRKFKRGGGEQNYLNRKYKNDIMKSDNKWETGYGKYIRRGIPYNFE